MVSAFATTGRLALGQEAAPDKASELAAIPVPLERLGADGGLEGALVSIDAVATNGTIARAIRTQGADYLLAVKANQTTLRAEVAACFAEAPAGTIDIDVQCDKGHRRVEERTARVLRDVDWLTSHRRFPGALRLPEAASIIKVETRAHLADRSRRDTRYFISSATLSAERAAAAVRNHWAIERQFRCHLRRRPVSPAKRPRCQEHGPRPPLRPQHRAQRHRQESP